jgi:putative spermidine/putrescine transport system permease protein
MSSGSNIVSNSAARSSEPEAGSHYKRALKRTQRAFKLLLIPLLAWLFLLYLYPLLGILVRSVLDPGLTLKHYAHFFSVSAYQSVLFSTTKIALFVTLACLIVGYPLAYLMATIKPRTANLLLILVLLPFWMSILVRTYAWMVLLGRSGIINSALMNLGLISSPLPLMYNWFGISVGMVHILLPFMILPLYSVMKGIDRNLMLAAQNLGANSLQAFIRVFLPLSFPGIAAGCLLVFIISLGFFITPSLLGGTKNMTISMLIESHVNALLNWGFASALSTILLTSTLLILLVSTRTLKAERLFGAKL